MLIAYVNRPVSLICIIYRYVLNPGAQSIIFTYLCRSSYLAKVFYETKNMDSMANYQVTTYTNF